MKKYTITYHLQPDAGDIKFDIMARDFDCAAAYAKDYRKEAFTIEEAAHQNGNVGGVSNLKDMRTRRGMTQAQLADASGISVRAVQDYEQGHKDINRAAAVTVYQIAQALRCAVEDIIEV